jgi:hypothetical protein
MMKYSPRTVENNLLISEGLPEARFQVGPQFTCVGNTVFTLYNAAHVEQHHFVFADTAKRVERLLWFQFEGYFDTNQYRYDYPGMETMTLDSLTFLHDADVMNVDADYTDRPDSDSAHALDFIKQEGYTLEGDVMYKRLVWLDPDLRNELMIIYSEDLLPTGFRIADLAEGSQAIDRRNSLFRDLHERALSSFRVDVP